MRNEKKGMLAIVNSLQEKKKKNLIQQRVAVKGKYFNWK